VSVVNVYLVGAKNPETRRQIDVQRQANPDFVVKGFIDNDPVKKGGTFLGYPIIGGIEQVSSLLKSDRDARFVNLITASTIARYETSRALADLGCQFTNLIHPSVDLTDVEIGVGNYIQDGVIIQAATRIGDNNSIHMAAIVGHGSSVGNSSFIAPAASVSGEVEIGDGVFVGTNASIIPRRTIGNWATIGAGAVVIKDVVDHAIVFGNPARQIEFSERRYVDGAIFAFPASR
jgi:sugar O-acyltransferase (sialic acid O-acetyltransferase NeuD family)